MVNEPNFNIYVNCSNLASVLLFSEDDFNSYSLIEKLDFWPRDICHNRSINLRCKWTLRTENWMSELDQENRDMSCFGLKAKKEELMFTL